MALSQFKEKYNVAGVCLTCSQGLVSVVFVLSCECLYICDFISFFLNIP